MFQSILYCFCITFVVATKLINMFIKRKLFAINTSDLLYYERFHNYTNNYVNFKWKRLNKRDVILFTEFTTKKCHKPSKSAKPNRMVWFYWDTRFGLV